MVMRKTILIIGVLILIAVLVPEFFGPPPESRWDESFNVDITKTLVKKGIRGCGEYQFKRVGSGNSDFLVRCTRDGQNWKLYRVHTYMDRVTGPISPDQALD
jgi:hypothetical protein